MTRQKTALRFLWLTVAASVIVPLLLFVYVAYLEFASANRQADDRLQYSLNVVQEHALKVLETIDRAIAETNEVISDLSDDEIRNQEPELHVRLKKIADSLHASAVDVDHWRRWATDGEVVAIAAHHDRPYRSRLFRGAAQGRRRALYRRVAASL